MEMKLIHEFKSYLPEQKAVPQKKFYAGGCAIR
jgi:hypothetical protein